MANRCMPGFLAKMKKELEILNRTIKEFLHGDGYNNIRSMDPWVGLRHLETNQIWGTDPVHIKRDHLACLAEGVKITLSKISLKRWRESQSGPPSKKCKITGGQVVAGRGFAGGGGSASFGGGSGGRGGGGDSLASGGRGGCNGRGSGGGGRGSSINQGPTPTVRGSNRGGGGRGFNGGGCGRRFGGGGGGRGWRGGKIRQKRPI
jgi:hypothetical protein